MDRPFGGTAEAFFTFGDRSAWIRGLTNLPGYPAVLTRSVEQECTLNEGGALVDAYNYVVNQPADEDLTTGREARHANWTLRDFHEAAPREAGLSLVEVGVLRMYTHEFFRPWNDALRCCGQALHDWATCVTILYGAIIKLSAVITRKARSNEVVRKVWRGVSETTRSLPRDFYEPTWSNNRTPGGAELGFMSTSTDTQTARDFVENGTSGSVLELEFDAASRGADVQFLSVWPAEQEVLFPPCTMITVRSVEMRSGVRTLLCSVTVNPSVPAGEVGDDFGAPPRLHSSQEQTQPNDATRNDQLAQRLISERVPREFLDPFTNVVFTDPVVAADGITYERACLVQWFEQQRAASKPTSSPITRARIGTTVSPNSDLLARIREHKTATLQGLEAIGLLSNSTASAASAGAASVGDEQSINNLGQLAAVYATLDRLRSYMDVSAINLETPMFVVLGAESCGKSSLLERLTMLPIFPRAVGLCTRMPIKIQLRRTLRPEPPVLETKNTRTGAIEGAPRIITLAAGEVDVREAMESAIIREHRRLVGISQERMLILSVSSPDVPDLDLVDLPGLVSSHRPGEPPELPRQTEELLERFSTEHKHHALFLVAMLAGSSPRDASILKVVQRLGIEAQSIGVFTKCDAVSEQHLRSEVGPRLLGTATDAVPLPPNGWVACMNAPVHDRTLSNPQILAFQAHEEVTFFGRLAALAPAKQAGLLGCNALVTKMHTLFLRYVERTWAPIAFTMVQDHLDSLQERLLALGEPAAAMMSGGNDLADLQRRAVQAAQDALAGPQMQQAFLRFASSGAGDARGAAVNAQQPPGSSDAADIARWTPACMSRPVAVCQRIGQLHTSMSLGSLPGWPGEPMSVQKMVRWQEDVEATVTRAMGEMRAAMERARGEANEFWVSQVRQCLMGEASPFVLRRFPRFVDAVCDLWAQELRARSMHDARTQRAAASQEAPWQLDLAGAAAALEPVAWVEASAQQRQDLRRQVHAAHEAQETLRRLCPDLVPAPRGTAGTPSQVRGGGAGVQSPGQGAARAGRRPEEGVTPSREHPPETIARAAAGSPIIEGRMLKAGPGLGRLFPWRMRYVRLYLDRVTWAATAAANAPASVLMLQGGVSARRLSTGHGIEIVPGDHSDRRLLLAAIGSSGPHDEIAAATAARWEAALVRLDDLRSTITQTRIMQIVEQVGREGDLRPVVVLMANGTDIQMEHAAAALRTIAFDDRNARPIVDAGAVPPLVRLMGNGTPAQREQACGALRNIASTHDEVRETIIRANALPALVVLVAKGTAEQVEQAAGLLKNLAAYKRNDVGLQPPAVAMLSAIANAGAIDPLISVLLRDTGRSLQKELATGALRFIARAQKVAKAISYAGAIPPLVKMLSAEGGTQATREHAAGALRHLALQEAYQVVIVRVGACGPLVSLMQNGSSTQADEAAYALQHLSATPNLAVQLAVIDAGALPAFVNVLSEGSRLMKQCSAAALSNFAAVHTKLRMKVMEADAIPPLGSLVRHGTDLQARLAALNAMRGLSTTPQVANEIVGGASGAINKMIELVQHGTNDEKEAAVGTIANLAVASNPGREAIARNGIAPLIAMARSGSTSAQKAMAAMALKSLALNRSIESQIRRAGYSTGWTLF